MPDLDALAVDTVSNRGLIDTFEDLRPGSAAALDLDFYAPGRGLVWIATVDDAGGCRSATVQVVHDGAIWTTGAMSDESWDGWLELARQRPARAWPDWGPILALGFESGAGSPGAAYTAVHGIAASDVVAIEFGVPGTTRRRGVDTMTGAFVVAVPKPLGDATVILNAILRGSSILDLSA